MKKIFLAFGAALCLSAVAQAQTELTEAELKAKLRVSSPTTVSIHDPSAVYRDGLYTIWGSHLGLAQSTDLVTFTPLGAHGNDRFIRLAAQGGAEGTATTFADAFNVQQATRVRNAKGQEVVFPNFDAEAYCNRYAADRDAWINGNMWAPDIIYNTAMKKWCMYLSLNGEFWNSIIVLLTANRPTGPFTYQGPVVMGGFDGQQHNGKAAPTYKDTDLEIALGQSLSATPARYIQTDNGIFWPNCIDPCVFYDEAGELWMAYGSWSGGIFMLKLDKATGLRDYTYAYASDYDTRGAQGVSDPYFGLKIAGGSYVSGEGCYIRHIGDYYYLFISYGFFSPEGGYDMRVFRSTSPTGPYVDHKGQSALFDRYVLNYGPGTQQRGTRLMGCWNRWGTLQDVGQRALGHNSVVQDGDGRTFLVAHTKFNDGTAGHQVRVHQLFRNSEGWLVAAPFVYDQETLTDAKVAAEAAIADDRIPGTYSLLPHPDGLDHKNMQETTPVSVVLTGQGKIEGDRTGTWQRTAGTDYISLTLGGTAYRGVLMTQSVSGATTQGLRKSTATAIAFSALGSDGNPLWGYKLDEVSALAKVNDEHPFPLTASQTVNSHQSLMFDATDNVSVSWQSTAPDIISETGKFAPAGEATRVTLTRTLRAGNCRFTQEAAVNAAKASTPGGDALTGLVAYYKMDELPVRNEYLNSAGTQTSIALAKLSAAPATAVPTLQNNWDRFGRVMQIAPAAQGQHGYARIQNPLFQAVNPEGFTIGFWVLRQSDDSRAALFGFSGNSASTMQKEHLFFTGNTYLDYSNASEAVTFKLNNPETGILSHIPQGRWTWVTLTVGAANGVRLYLNGTTRNWTTYDAVPSALRATDLPYADVLATLSQLRYLFLGAGSLNGSPACQLDELMIYKRELSSTDARSLYQLQQRTTDFTVGQNGTAIIAPWADSHASQRPYTLSGRQAARNDRGIIIRKGKKLVRR
ncbi:MAG: family 43 glycosylhydrolase [Prevotellaceae bacterium]|nr:family 43 glycosylhydrolase [Prevotellaceae bacterium]